MSIVDSYTKLLLHLNGYPPLTDLSATPKAVTAVGGALTTTAQSALGGCSLELNGSTGYLSIPDHDDFYFAPEDFTIDFRIRFKSLPDQVAGDEWGIYRQGVPGSGNFIMIIVGANGTGGHYLTYYSSTTTAFDARANLSAPLVINIWYHISIVRSSNLFTWRLNGITEDTPSTHAVATDNLASDIIIGNESTYFLDAYLDEFRVSKIARWTADFTPSTVEYTSDANTSLLLHFYPDPFIDSSLSPKTVTTSGAVMSTTSPKFNVASAYFDGSNDYLSLADSDDWYFNGDFTVDFWVKLPALTSGGIEKFFYGQDAGDTFNALALGFYWTGTRLEYKYHAFGDTNMLDSAASGITATNTWYHIAVTGTTDGSNQTVKVYTNGVLKVTSSVYAISNVAAALLIGKKGTTFLNFYLSEFRISKGIVRWATDFTPPTVPYGSPEIYNEDINEGAEVLDSPVASITYNPSVSDTFYIRDTITYQLTVLVQEALGLTDSVAATLCIKITEILVLAETQSVQWTGTSTINDGFVLTDQVARELSLVISEALDLADSPSAVLGLIIAEFLAISEAVTANWNSTRTVEDTLRLVDLPPLVALSLVLTEALTIVDDAPISHLSLAVYEYLGFTDIVSAAGQFNSSLSDEIWAADSVQLSFAQVVSDALAAVDVVSVVSLLINSINESLAASDAVSGALTVPVSVGETLTLADTVSSQGILYNVIYDTLHLGVTVELDGEVWECYVLNTPKFLPSIYSGFNFNSYCVFENRAYGCRKSDGIHELTGDTDNGVAFHTGVQFSDTTFGIPNQKRFRKAYVGVSGTSPRMVMETEKGEKKIYAIDSDGEVDASRALRSKKWKLAVTDFDSLDFMKLYPVVLSK